MTVEVRSEDLWTMLLSTVRYSMGRATYMPGLCAELYDRYQEHLSREERLQIMREIEAEIEFRARTGGKLGWDCDHQVWVNLIARIRAKEFP